MIETGADGRTRSLSGNPGEDGFGYSQGLLSGPVIQISGQVGRDNASGELIGETTLAERLTQALKNVREVATEIGGFETAIISLQLHLKQGCVSELGVIAEQIQKVAGEDAPVVTLVPVFDLFSPEYLVEVSAMATTEKRTTIPDAGPIGSVIGSSKAVRVGDEIFLAGHLGVDAHGAITAESRAEQLERIFGALELTLSEVGGTIADVVSTHTWVLAGATTAEMQQFHAVHSRHFASVKPAATLLFVSELPLGAMVQMSAVARVGS